MKVEGVEIDLVDNGDFLDVDVTITVQDKYEYQYRWCPYKDVSTQQIGIGHFEFAENPLSDWEEVDKGALPKPVVRECYRVMREVCEKLGAPYVKMYALMTNLYDPDTLKVAGSNQTSLL